MANVVNGLFTIFDAADAPERVRESPVGTAGAVQATPSFF